MKKVLAFIFGLFMVFMPIFGVVHAEGEPQGKNKIVCDELWKNVKVWVPKIKKSGLMFMNSGNMTEEARKVFDKYGAEYQICKIIYKDGKSETILLMSQEEKGCKKTYACDFFTAIFVSFFHHDSVEDAGREFLFMDKDTYFQKAVRIGKDVTIVRIEYFDKTGQLLGFSNVASEHEQGPSAYGDVLGSDAREYDVLECDDSGY